MAKMAIRSGSVNKKKTLSLLLIVVLALIYLTSCGGNDAKVVRKIPDRFVHLEKGGGNWGNGLHYIFWKSMIVFLDADEITIYQIGLNNSDFVVKYKNKYYVSEEKLLELLNVAAISPEQRRKTYNLGDEVEIRGAGETVYTVKIISLEAILVEPYGLDDSLITYNIKYAVTSNVIENESIMLISWVETEYGAKYDEFSSIDTETLSIKIRVRKNDEIDAIVLKNPDYLGLTYRVVLDK